MDSMGHAPTNRWNNAPPRRTTAKWMVTSTTATMAGGDVATAAGCPGRKVDLVSSADYRDRINAEYPHYRMVHNTRIEKATRVLITHHALEWDKLMVTSYSYQAAKAELRRRHRDEWRSILKEVPGTLGDVRLGCTVEDVRDWTPS